MNHYSDIDALQDLESLKKCQYIFLTGSTIFNHFAVKIFYLKDRLINQQMNE